MNYTISGRLFKLSTTNKLGGSKWQSRYFVLLDTELRYYKNEHSVSSSSTINLCNVLQITRTRFFNHNYCFRLETTEEYQRQSKRQKTWTMECNSEHELDMWLAAINNRLNKLFSNLRKNMPKNSLSRRRGLVLSHLEIDLVPALDSPSSSSSKETVLPKKPHSTGYTIHPKIIGALPNTYYI